MPPEYLKFISDFVTQILPKLSLATVAIVLGLVNGFHLLKKYVDDKPKLVVEPIHPDTYQWYFELPNGNYHGQQTRKYGFLAYIAIKNKGLRDVCLTSWRLKVLTKRLSWPESKPYSISEPNIEMGRSGLKKQYPVLGMAGERFDGETLVKSGHSISGFAYYVMEFWGNPSYDIHVTKNELSVGKLIIQHVYGGKSKTNIVFKKKTLADIQKIIPGIDKIDERNA